MNRVYWMVVKSVFGDLIGYRYMFFRGGKFIYVGYAYMEDEVYIWKVDEYCTLFDTVISEIDVPKRIGDVILEYVNSEFFDIDLGRFGNG